MKIPITIIFFILFSLFNTILLAQEKSNICFELSRPIIEKSIFDRYLLDFGTGYNYHFKQIYFGCEFTTLYSKLRYSGNDTKTFILKPNINISYPINPTSKICIEPKLGCGYSFIIINSDKYELTDYQQGVCTLVEFKINYQNNAKFDYYMIISHDYIHLKKDVSFTQLNYYRNMHLMRIGIGLILKFD
ncbi:MAG: hypothetical protein Kow0068_01630 [Marinilabiliales bacterium]